MKTLILALSLSLAGLPMAMPLLSSSAYAAAVQSALGDLSTYEVIAEDTLVLVKTGDMTAAQKRITDFEGAWDASESVLYHKDKNAWGVVDDAADAAITALRASNPDQAQAASAVSALIAALQNPAM